ncbi:MAG TPA: pyridoxal phosphate-dependent aminotransferase [Paenalcaligenes sp.]|nr:pyridoxal phosphate-dependent aminotransferase [Paenalcaligenes sp.]
MPRSAHLAQRTESIVPFHAVELFKSAQALSQAGHDIISLGIGEPDFTAPTPVVEALKKAADQGLTQYTPPAGTPALREALSRYYAEYFQAQVAPERIIITAGASGALSLVCLSMINPGDEILMPDPSYPANQNFIVSAGGVPKLIPTEAAHRFHLTAADIEAHWGPNTRGVLIASPNNPTGASINPDDLRALVAAVRARDGFIIMDEIYLGLYYETAPQSALCIDDDIVIINSFSKYFHMTGWRLGWAILPPELNQTAEKLAASLSICAPSLAQHAALACFQDECLNIYEERRLAFKARRDYLVPALEAIGFDIPVHPDGAFYIYADMSKFGADSYQFSQHLLNAAHVAAVPGIDFGPHFASRMLRFSYATDQSRLEQAIARMDQLLNAGG